ncbi:MAG: bifunctional (p)ppGpp synthetase/guanosine-3',5'-bis(diphosphate) 3'-pyrophosphohydrolase [Cytophagales bacterium]|nr:bifunctional (p)ppGpp synthetase/guanosine-3',5'-bis(diphosphate) 3'-pyrophosphohydrolase [Cytophagales bacterium]
MRYQEGGNYTQDMIDEARLVAIHIHGNQNYDNIFPYEKHLADVVRILEDFNYTGKYLIAGWLHDSIEDGAISYNKIKNYFGLEVAEMVYAVSDELGRNRKEKKEKTYPKIRHNPDAVVIKLADRIANIQHGGKIEMYQKEYQDFKNNLYLPGIGESLWNKLESLLKL